MSFVFAERLSDSPLVDLVWSTKSGDDMPSFISIAEHQLEMVITKQESKMSFTIRGPETLASIAPVPKNAEILGIIFRFGTFLNPIHMAQLVDNSHDALLACHNAVWLGSDTWEIPTFDNVDDFITALFRDDVIAYDPLIEQTLSQEDQLGLSLRTLQRRFLKATGITHKLYEQMQRAKNATALLEQGTSILDTVFKTGYADQPHLTRSLKRFMGRTPVEIIESVEPS